MHDLAVLTGDIVGASRLSGDLRAGLPDLIDGASHQLQGHFQDVPYRIRTFRGESWQFLVSSPEISLRVALFFRSIIRSSLPDHLLDTRIGIGIGPIDLFPPEDLSSGDGKAFRLSHQVLVSMPRDQRLDIGFPVEYQTLASSGLREILKWIDQAAQQWTARQALSVSGALLDLTQKKIAKRRHQGKISQQAVAQHLKRANWQIIESSLIYYEKTLPHITGGQPVS